MYLDNFYYSKRRNENLNSDRKIQLKNLKEKFPLIQTNPSLNVRLIFINTHIAILGNI